MTEFDELFLQYININQGEEIDITNIFSDDMINKISNLSKTSSDPRFKELMTIISRKFDHNNDDEYFQYVSDILTCIGFELISVTETPSILQ